MTASGSRSSWLSRKSSGLCASSPSRTCGHARRPSRDGSPPRPRLGYRPRTDANLRAAESTRAVGQVINVANGERTTLNELLAQLKQITGRGGVPTDYREARTGDVRHSLADITRARDLLGYEPRVGLEEGLTATLAWWKQSRFAQ